MDFDSENDAYVVLKLGNQTITDNEPIMDNNNPKFYRCYELDTYFPGPSNL